jgi:alpha-D-ribose 1-methylphosphonate 5-triphosphate synthase subunit PhnG
LSVMEKMRLFTIMAKAGPEILSQMAEEIKRDHEVLVIKEPGKTLAMIKMREPVESSLFYLGEVIVCEAAVEIEGTKGMAVTMGDQTEKVLHMAIIDAAVNKGVFTGMDTLLRLERLQSEDAMRENAMHLKTMVNFTSMDQEVPK